MTLVNGYDLLYLFFSLWALIATVFSMYALYLHLCGDKQIKIMHWPNSSSEACHYFTPRRTVEWFDFMGLVHSFKRVALSTETLSIIDKREVEAGFGEDAPIEANKTQQSLWVDFMADTGDGIDSTATVFSAVTRKSLHIKDAEGKPVEIPRGNLLIVGGDLVYPVASEDSYIDRFKGPMRLVFPYSGDANKDTSTQPFLLATPGNHDWYDGLTAFFRLICQQKDIGNYKTVQNRSYFSFRLLPNVHVMGIDNQLMGDVDIPQINFFKKYASRLKSETVIHHIIIVVAEPYWYNFVAADAGKRRQRMDSLTYFIREITANVSNLKVRMVISGDMHHYSRYHNYSKDSDVTDYVTSGGGGAFMHMTSFLRTTAELPCFKTASVKSEDGIPAGTTKKVFFPTAKYKLEKTYPSSEQSRKHNRHNLLFAIHNFKFCVILLMLSLFSLYLFNQSHDIVLKIAGFIIVPGFLLFINYKMQLPEQSGNEKKVARLWTFLLFIFTMVLNWLILKVIPNPHNVFALASYRNVDFFMTASLIAITQSILLGLYLYFSYRFSKIHITEASSSFVNDGYKNFLRMQVTETGITVYAIGIKKAQNWWKMLKKKSSKAVLQLQKDSATGEEDAVKKYFKNYKKDNHFLIESFSISFKDADKFGLQGSEEIKEGIKIQTK